MIDLEVQKTLRENARAKAPPQTSYLAKLNKKFKKKDKYGDDGESFSFDSSSSVSNSDKSSSSCGSDTPFDEDEVRLYDSIAEEIA